MSENVNQFGEPFSVNEAGDIIDASGTVALRMLPIQGRVTKATPLEQAHRIVACVNALAGIADPEAAVKWAIKALRGVQKCKCIGSIDCVECDEAIRAALAALGGGE